MNTRLAADADNSLLKVDSLSADVTVVAGGVKSQRVADNTAVAFGRSKQQEDVLHVMTNGGLAYPTPGGVVGVKSWLSS